MGKKRTVKPIQDLDTILDIRDYLKKWNNMYGLLFTLGIYSGFRISDMLPLKVRDIRMFLDDDMITIVEKKTKELREIGIHPDLKKDLKEFIKDKEDWEYIFASQKKSKGVNKPITREHAGRVIKAAASKFGVDKINTHSMRKTFAYFLYVISDRDITIVKEALGHEDPRDTIRYIGLDRDRVNDYISKLDFSKQVKKKRKPFF